MMHDVGDELRQEWWGLITTGLVSIAFGLVALVWPGLTVAVFALLIAILILVFGIVDIVNGIRGLKERFSKFLQIILGIVQVAVAVYLLDHASKGIALALVSLVIALTFIARGIVGLFLAFDRESDTMSRWLSAVTAVLGIIVAILILRYPVQGTLAYVWLVGLFALVSGAFDLALGFQAKDSKPAPKKRQVKRKK
jgi:uncharacterized membrane protein HdeD (DUF308 family)